jgi:hypothetical protein
MRQGHQNRRGRGRNNNNQNRKGQNPLTRSFESNGPDVKIRGTPAHIAEKYISLARDAKSAGDEVLAENYLQHAEHYNRIILAFREQQVGQGGDMGGMGQRIRVPQLQDPLDDEDFGEDGDDFGGDQPQIARGNEPQPSIPQGQMYEGGEPRERFDNQQDGRQDGRHDFRQGGREQQQHRGDRSQRFDDRNQRRHNDQFRHRDRDRDRGDRDQRQGDFNRPPMLDRGPGERHAGNERPSGDPQSFGDRGPSSQPAGGPGQEAMNGQHPRQDGGMPRGDRDSNGPRRRERYQPPGEQHEQPEFLRRPVRRPRREAAGEGEGDTNGAAPHAAPARDESGTTD